MARRKFNWQLPVEIENRLGDTTYGRQRTIFEKGHLLIILHAPPNPDHRTREMQVFLRTPEGNLLCNGSDHGQAMMKRLMLAYMDLYQAYNKKFDKAGSSERLFKLMEDLIPAHRSATHLYETLQTAREQSVDDKFLIAIRDDAYEMQRCFELLLADTRLALDFELTRHAEAQAAKAEEALVVQRRLNILAAGTFPLIALGTILGMNLTNGFEGMSPIVFWCVFGTGALIGLSLKSWVVNQKTDDAS